MTQASSWWQLINQVPGMKTGSAKQRHLQRFSEPGLLLGLLTVIVAMLFWNWKLLLALVVGISVMTCAYSLQKWNWQLSWLEIRKFLDSANHRLALAVTSGGIATVVTYMAASIWVDAQSHWIAAGAIVQGIGTILTLVLLVWQIFSLNGKREEDYLEQLLHNLTAPDPLKRLVAVRQLTKYLSRPQVDTAIQQDVIECLQLLLTQEEEEVIRQAALNSLQILTDTEILSSTPLQPLRPIPTKLKQELV
ncbi:hypothetical protein B6N60_01150 [Richelia sinica FACHB-800]|uniref:Armadillo-type fold-containing protein n=1 Tax=Richelia sinica FACHB-800 TaxID=1357546 RepID=A0A975Y3U3_9NOST|nr:armadillo-type fold-containing protein [Richelia sinica]MBD2664301.1 armadillo-type fold-containing protein [Richelia sinica FACHB-800]QXE22467.1 hypothetical protein B6N60_01150 [Richelia sinica FACHB-800]